MIPTIDLHGDDSLVAKIKFNEYVNDNRILRNKEFYVIHGIGKGILRKVILEEAKNNKYVLKTELDILNPGVTKIYIDLN